VRGRYAGNNAWSLRPDDVSLRNERSPLRHRLNKSDGAGEGAICGHSPEQEGERSNRKKERMSDDSDGPKARVVTYQLSRVRQGQSLVPVAFFLTLAARYIQHPILVGLAIAADVLTLVAFVRARRAFSEHPLSLHRGGVSFGANGAEILPIHVTAWVWEGSTARLYGSDAFWKIRSAPDNQAGLCALLRKVFGEPVIRRRKGSRKARVLSIGAFLIGLACVAASQATNLWGIGLLGVAASFLGLVAFITFSQKIVANASPERRERPRTFESRRGG
jgi:hypothetical protein